MLIAILAVLTGLTLIGLQFIARSKYSQQKRALAAATDSGVTMDRDRNINAEKTFATMSQYQEQSGEQFTRKQARFMELMRVVTAGPQTVEEVRFLFAEGINPVVRPDGLVYVPCIENDHLSIDGELELAEEDLDTYIERGFVSQESVSI